MLTIAEIITIFITFQIGNWFSYFVVHTSLEASLESLFISSLFATLLCLIAATKMV